MSGFAEIFSVPNVSTSGRKMLILTDGMEEPFSSLKLKLTTWPVLAFRDFNRASVVETDAFCLLLGTVLAWKKEDARFTFCRSTTEP